MLDLNQPINLKVKHLSPMLSLSNAFDLNDMKNFQKKVNNLLLLKDQQLELFANRKLTGYPQH